MYLQRFLGRDFQIRIRIFQTGIRGGKQSLKKIYLMKMDVWLTNVVYACIQRYTMAYNGIQRYIMVYNWYTIGIQMVYGIQLVYNWYTVGIQLVYSWYTVGIQLVYSWYTVGIQLVYNGI